MRALRVVGLVCIPLACAFASALPRFKHLVTFGDSYTDTVQTGDGGVAWPVYAAGYANLTLHPFARAGATCSNNITRRGSPPVMESQVPAFTDAQLQLPPDETVYTLWIGTNDVGASTLLTGSSPGVTVVDTTACAVDWVRVMYHLGARYFVFQNMIPLQLTQMYAPSGHLNRYWHFERNATAWTVGITELTTARNALSALMLPALARTLPGAHISLFDSHALFTDMFTHPDCYLNGTAPPNVTGSINECVYDTSGPVGGKCPPAVQGTERDSYLWYDELHPSEQADRVVAREIVAALEGSTRWATWIS